MPRATELVRAFVRPPDHLGCLLTVHAPPAAPRSDERVSRRLIALITHNELGSLLVLHASTADGVVTAVDALPITETLALGVAQSSVPVDPHPEESDPEVKTEAVSAWLLSIRRDAQDVAPLTFAVRNRNIQKLQTLAAECRRLKEIAATAHPVTADFAWLEAYFRDPSSRRLDLRVRNLPLLKRLATAVAGFPGDDALDISVVRRDWIAHTAAKQASGSEIKHLKIRVGTFNVNGKAPSQDLYPWLRGAGSDHRAPSVSPDMHQETASLDSQPVDDPDLLVLGFQELDLSTEALLYATNTLKEDEWLTAVFAGLGEKRTLYEKFVSRQLVGMLLVVIVKKDLARCFTDVRSCDAGSGIMGWMGNKGATAIRFNFTPKVSLGPPVTTYRSTVLTFVNAHLAASDEMVERRNSDFQELSIRLVFPPNALNGTYSSDLLSEDTYNVYQSDVLFWMVHLNYRLDLADEDVRKLLSSHTSDNNIQALLSYDQLKAAMRSSKAFSSFTEHSITHNPTYRFASGLSTDQLGYDIKRKPAWTDRILYMTPVDVEVEQTTYTSHPEITMSDHQPVSADFDISLGLINRVQYENAVSTLHRELAGFEDTEHRPIIKVQPTSVELGTIKYKHVVRREVVLRNDGEIPSVFHFVGTGDGADPISPAWLHVEPTVGLLRPQETMTIFLSISVDDNLAAELNSGPLTLECTLILHTALGKDDFIAISGEYQYTCFANTLERLTRLVGPVRKLASPEALMPAEQAINAPREIMRLINWMMAHVSATDALFEHTADECLCGVIRECLDTGDEFPHEEGPEGDHSTFVAAFSSTLVELLDSLVEPVVPARLHAQCMQVKDKDEAFEVLNEFPRESINVWISLTAFLHYVVQHQHRDHGGDGSKEELDTSKVNMAYRLASVFAPVLLRDDPTGVHPRASPVGKRGFLLRFIE